MANLIEKDNKRRTLVRKKELTRLQYKSIIKNKVLPLELRSKAIFKLHLLPKNSSKVRIKNRCVVSGRGKSVYKFCKLSRIQLRDLAPQAVIPGLFKSSW